MNTYLFQILSFLCVYFIQIRCNSTETETSFQSTMVTSTMISTISSISTGTSPSSSVITQTSTSNMSNSSTSVSETSMGYSTSSFISTNSTLTSSLSTSSVESTKAPTVNYQIGESPPGVGAQLGMGLGISFIGLLLIVEIIYCYRKYGCSTFPTRQPHYELHSHEP